MLSIPLIITLTISLTLAENCDKDGIVIYEDMKCEPLNYKDNCPTNYKCDGLTISNKCYYQGIAYTVGEALPKNSVGLSCRFRCLCSEKKGVPSVACAQGSCIEYSGLPPEPGCYRKYNLENCCSSGQICQKAPFMNETRCLVDGVEYREGERFISQKTCHTCVCQKGWNGEYVAPFCKRYGCDVQIHNQYEVQKACAPVYYKIQQLKKCCPDLWICPDGKEEVIEPTVNNLDGLTCKFGKTVLPVGSKFKKETQHAKLSCECKIPPLVTCVET